MCALVQVQPPPTDSPPLPVSVALPSLATDENPTDLSRQSNAHGSHFGGTYGPQPVKKNKGLAARSRLQLPRGPASPPTPSSASGPLAYPLRLPLGRHLAAGSSASGQSPSSRATETERPGRGLPLVSAPPPRLSATPSAAASPHQRRRQQSSQRSGD